MAWRTTSSGGSVAGSGANGQQVYEYEVTHTADMQTAGLPQYATNWNNQMSIYSAIVNNPALSDSSALLAQFASMAVRSRYAWLLQIEGAIAANAYDSATSLMSIGIDAYTNTIIDTASGVTVTDSIAADGIVSNYLSYYGIFIKYNTGSMSADDSTTLGVIAAMCPDLGGAVVFKARNLYEQVFGNSLNWSDYCGDAGARYAQGTTTNATKQLYTLFPNPNDGNLTLMQSVIDKNDVSIEVINAYGQVVNTFTINMSNYATQLHLGKLVTGLYMLHITSKDNEMYNLKFVVQ